MKRLRPLTLVALGALTGCMAGGQPLPAQSPGAGVPGPIGSPFADRPGGVGVPLLLDRADLGMGTTVYFNRMPTAGELHDLELITGLQHVVISLPEWPSEYAHLEGMARIPAGVDVIVLLSDYPPSRAAAEAWNLLDVVLRIIIVVPGPPSGPGVVSDLNSMRHLERVIARMDVSSRAGFERLQRPLSFMRVVE